MSRLCPEIQQTQVATYKAFNFKLSQTTKPNGALHIDSQCYKK